MKYLRKNINGRWVVLKLENPELSRAFTQTIELSKKIMKKLKKEKDFSEAERVAIFSKVAPNYFDFINDYIEEQIEKGQTSDE